jgi:phosphatidate cytidylyltransferase
MSNEKMETQTDKKQKSTFLVRLISTVFLLLLLIAYCGSGIMFQELSSRVAEKWVVTFAYISMVLTMILMSYCLFELTHVFKEFNKPYIIMLFILLNLIMYLIPTNGHAYDFAFYAEFRIDASWWIWVVVLAFIAYFVVFLIIGLTAKKVGLKKAMYAFLGMFFIVIAFKGFTILMLSGPQNVTGRYSYVTVLWIWLMAIFSDTFAYVAGSKIGKTKLAPVISPKKTWEGAYVGLATATGAGIIVALLLHFFAKEYQPFYQAIMSLDTEWSRIVIIVILAICFPIISMLGDLFYSLIKRFLNVKDYSNLIPGHGGMLDRLDSFIFVNAVAFLLVGFI